MSCNSLLVVPQLLSQLERNAILVHFDSLTWSSLKSTNHFDVALPDRPVMFVKYGNRAILAEASTQSLFHALAQGDSMAPRIPRVYDAFHGTRCCFLVMEKVDQPTLAECTLSDAEAIERAAFAVRWLIRQIQHIPVSVFGRIAADHKAHARHRFFKDHDAPLAFANATALTKFVNKALSRCLPARRPDPIAFSDARFIYHSDVSKHNFLLDPETSELWLIDFEHVGVFPEPFQQYGFFNIGSPFASAVGRALDIIRRTLRTRWQGLRVC